eukprot:229897-Chlamydomonas_euryale.AAC.14
MQSDLACRRAGGHAGIMVCMHMQASEHMLASVHMLCCPVHDTCRPSALYSHESHLHEHV